MLKCRDINGLLHDYAEGLLELSVHKELDRHLSDCPGCLAFVKTYKETIRLSKDLRTGEMPPELQEKLESFLKAKLAEKPKTLWDRLRSRFGRGCC